jgi:hypothetical protein
MKKKSPFRLLVLVMLGLFFCQLSTAQKTKTKSPEPSWIAMMDDPNVNYYAAVKAFDTYWKNKEKPVEEGDLFESVEDMAKEREIIEKAIKMGKNDPALIYAFDYKRFLMWKNKVEPFVKPDGRIKNMDEIIADWKVAKQQKQSQEKNKNNPKQKN